MPNETEAAGTVDERSGDPEQHLAGVFFLPLSIFLPQF
jgi:hypothetical protein